MEEKYKFWTITIENIVRNNMEDIHSRNELTDVDMMNMNIKLRNNIFTHLIDNNLKINRNNLFDLLVDVLDEYKDKVEDENEFLDNIKDSVNEVIKAIIEYRDNPEFRKLLMVYYRDFKYEPPVYLN
jgi:hypothetical protein